MILNLRSCYLILLLLLAQFGFSQQKRSFTVPFIQEKIKIDRVLNEGAWQKVASVSDYWQFFPTDTVKGKHLTEIWMAYDDKNLYVAARCKTIGKKYVIPSLRRDYRAGASDNLSFIFDTFDDRTNAFLFGMNPYGVQREATISGGGQGVDPQYFSTAWDNKWEGESKIYEDYWTTEVAIPFTTLRFKEGTTHWNFNSYRFDTQTNEQQTWTHIPQNQLIFNLAFMGEMNFEKALSKSGSNISIIPYAFVGNTRDFDFPERGTGNKVTVGGDVKIGITSGLNLDLTVNPNFSQVEADRQVTNLSRFDVSYPEQRQFFLENADLFSNLGAAKNPLNISGSGASLTPFFSRKIGIAYDTTTGTFVQNAINYGARISGKINNTVRVGLLNIGSAKDESRLISDANITVGILQKKVFSRSNITVFGVNKQTLSPELNPKLLMAYNRVFGAEYNLQSSDNVWFGKFFYHQAVTPIAERDKWSSGVLLNYNVYRWNLLWEHQYVGKGFDAEVGFIPRKDFFRFAPQAQMNFYPHTKLINNYSIGVQYDQTNAPGIGMTDNIAGINWNVTTQQSVLFGLILSNNYTYLFNDFDPTLSGNLSLKAGSEYRYTNLQAYYFSDQRKRFATQTSLTVGGYFNGSLFSVSGALAYRFQPYGSFTLNYSYNKIDLPTGKGNLWLLGPKADITFSKTLFWTTAVQYNSQFNNLNINSRLQWRFAPVSDIFFVYTDNYYAANNFKVNDANQQYLAHPAFQAKNRAFILKMTYWLNL